MAAPDRTLLHQQRRDCLKSPKTRIRWPNRGVGGWTGSTPTTGI